jgi:hypothetical protein
VSYVELGIAVPMYASAGVTCVYGVRMIAEYLRGLERPRTTSEELPEWGAPEESGPRAGAGVGVLGAVRSQPLAALSIAVTIAVQVVAR